MSIVKAVCICSALLLSAFSSAQSESPAQTFLQRAARDFSGSFALRADLQGTEQDPRGVRQVAIASAYQQGRFAANEYLGTSLVRRFCADGTRFWYGDFGAKTYSVVGYGAGSNDGTGTFVKSPTLAFLSVAKGPASFLARLFEDLYGGKTARLPKWLPNAIPTYVGIDNVGDFEAWLVDPVFPNRVYAPTQSTFFVMEYQGRPVTKSLVWQFAADWDEESKSYLNPRLARIHSAERVGGGSTGELRQWTLTLTTENQSFSDSAFTFSPPNDWRSTSLPIRGDGG